MVLGFVQNLDILGISPGVLPQVLKHLGLYYPNTGENVAYDERDKEEKHQTVEAYAYF